LVPGGGAQGKGQKEGGKNVEQKGRKTELLFKKPNGPIPPPEGRGDRIGKGGKGTKVKQMRREKLLSCPKECSNQVREGECLQHRTKARQELMGGCE